MNPFKALYELTALNLRHTKQSFSMAGSELKKKYSSTLFGWAWSIVRPLVFIFVYWFAMSVGIRGNKPIELESGEKIPYIIWMIPGVVAWFVLQETLSAGVVCVRHNSHLVNKMLFPVGTIPVFSTISYFFSHILMIVISIIIFAVAKYPLTVYMLQLPFYLLLFFIFCCITATFISTLGVISRDFEQFIKAILNIFFWMSPVLWQITKVENKYIAFALKLNPFNYFITGYRDAFLGQAWFWEHQKYTIYIIVFIVLFALFTATLHKKLAPEFADVL